MLPHFPHIGVQLVSKRMGKSEFLVPRSNSPLTTFFACIHTLAGWLSGKTVVSPVGGWVSCEQGPRQGHGSCHCTSCPTQPPPSIPTNIGQCPNVSEQLFWACLILPNAFQPTVYRTQVFQSSGPNVTHTPCGDFIDVTLADEDTDSNASGATWWPNMFTFAEPFPLFLGRPPLKMCESNFQPGAFGLKSSRSRSILQSFSISGDQATNTTSTFIDS